MTDPSGGRHRKGFPFRNAWSIGRPTCAWARLGKNQIHLSGWGLLVFRATILKPIDQRKPPPMANTAQSKKRARQADARYAVNKARRSRIRTFLRKVEEAIASGNGEAAQAALKAAQPELARGVTKGVLHKNTVARKMSRLASRVNAVAKA